MLSRNLRNLFKGAKMVENHMIFASPIFRSFCSVSDSEEHVPKIKRKRRTMKEVAVVLSGCGVFDGTELTEVSSFAIALSQNKANVTYFAPNIEQLHTVNHLTSEQDEVNRNVLVESARIARGDIADIEKLSSDDFDALILPGGFGAAKSLCDFSQKGHDYTVIPQVKDAIADFHASKKPIGAACIASLLIAKSIPDVCVTLGKENKENYPFQDAITAAKEAGARVKDLSVKQVCVDKRNKVATTPAFMKHDATPAEIFNGIQLCVQEIRRMIEKKKKKVVEKNEE